jgi:histone H3/H4
VQVDKELVRKQNNLAKILEDMAADIAEDAVKCAKHAGRVTIQASDIEMSCK